MYDYQLKTIVVGSVGTGKTCLLNRLTTGQFSVEIPHTIGAVTSRAVLTVFDKKTNRPVQVKLLLYDTAGQERFKAITKNFFRGSAAALVVFDLSRKSTLSDAASWLVDVRSLTGPHTVLLLIGAKSDLQNSRQVSYEEARRFAEDCGFFDYVEISSLTGSNVEDAFVRCAQRVVDNVAAGLQRPDDRDSGVTEASPVIARSTVDVSSPAERVESKGCSC